MPRGSLLTRVADDFEDVSLKGLFALAGKLGRYVGKYIVKRSEDRMDNSYEKDHVFEIWHNDDGEFLFFYSDCEEKYAEGRKQVL